MPLKPQARLFILPCRPRTSPSVFANFNNRSAPARSHKRTYAESNLDDPSLHPNPSVKPQTDPSAPAGNPTRNAQSQSNVQSSGPNMDPLPHVSEEAAAISKAKGTEGPDVEQGTPVREVRCLDRLSNAQSNGTSRSKSSDVLAPTPGKEISQSHQYHFFLIH